MSKFDKFYSVVFIILVVMFVILSARWYSAPCGDFKSDPILMNGSAPARCTVISK